MNSDLTIFIEQHAAQYPYYRNLRLDHDGRIIWIKQHVACKQKSWHRLQRILTRIIPLAILKTTVSNFHSIVQEADRLRHFKERGAPVADLLHARPGLLAVSDVGPQLRETIDKTSDTGERKRLLELAALSLSRLHQTGLCHGRPALKDMTILDDKIHFIDLEEDPLQVMTLAQAQARDIWLFLNSCVSYVADDAEELLKIYRIATQSISPEALSEMTRMVRILKPVRLIAEYAVAPLAGKDIRYAVTANKMLERILL